ncbi:MULTISPECIES: type IV secretion system DNA-binding domain-containing protein [unclassified Devosia]|uniref:type IV secretory system conjugative DNA transfer family protein n=1 Tax=unclassified Devosia TaxID=196773 RepID=UPI00086A9ED9|nr:MULTISPECIES: type IV secretion system DNA-binding domain-containing protein [unclassified Devosia]MBN9360716.1 type IV secretion system DNA-binding domain-containing protein [Devosia sp.]ODS87908.1 MAG: hypothetical protein ABS47_11015 [Devosia sp. SCN 66-27]OJX22684.1 MAG: hypothetical protein BGO83_17990 [Devosia sp. 66-14]
MDESFNDILALGTTNARSDRRRFGIKQRDRLSHVYIIGKTGTGKSSLIEAMARQDIVAGRGLAVLDPHGDLVQRLAVWALPRRSDVLNLDLADPNLRFGYNPLLRVSPEHRSLVASGAIDLFKLVWSDAWGVRMEHILRNGLLALLEQPKAELADLLPLLTDKAFRLKLLAHVKNEQVRSFWMREYPNYSFRYQADGIAPIQNKIGAFLADPRLRRFLSPSDGGLRLRAIMDRRKVLLVNLAQGRVGTDSSRLVGGLLVTAMGSAAFSRADHPDTERPPFFVYIDEFQSFTTLALANMLAELRKYGVGMVLAHQYLAQLDPAIGAAVHGNAGTLICFRVGGADATVLAKEFRPIFAPEDLMTLPNYSADLKLLIDGQPSRPFSATMASAAAD